MDVEELLNDIDNIMNTDEIVSNCEEVNANKPINLDKGSDVILSVPIKEKSSELLSEIDDLLNNVIPDIDDQQESLTFERSPCVRGKICSKLNLMNKKNINNYCNQVRCLNCDHIVMLFNKCKWDSSVDNLFFRLNFPNKNRLKKKLLTDNIYCCYACQCQFINIKMDTNNELSRKMTTILMQWQCCGH